MSIRDQVNTLKPLVGKLSRSHQDFAHSLIGQWEKKGRLSQPQQLWVDKLIEEAVKEKPAPPPAPQAELGVSLKPLHDLFQRAKGNKIQFPKIKTQLEDGTKVELSLANANSVNAGSVYVKKGGEWYAKVDSAGHMTISRKVPVCEEVHEIVKAIAANPSAAGKVHGQKFDNCMFCGRGLTTKDSVYYGYGPICAEKWGLEWGIAHERLEEEKVETQTATFNDMVNKFFKDFQ
jgi:hypothetical protein